MLGDAHKQSNRDLSGFGAASEAANFITELHLESNLAAAAPIRAGQGAAGAAASTLARQGRARAAAPFRTEQGATRVASQFRARQGHTRAAAQFRTGQGRAGLAAPFCAGQDQRATLKKKRNVDSAGDYQGWRELTPS